MSLIFCFVLFCFLGECVWGGVSSGFVVFPLVAHFAQLLQSEGCPKCLGVTSTVDRPCVILSCRDIECQHVVHISCLLNLAPLMPTLHRFHSTSFFRTIPVSGDEPDPVSRGEAPGLRQCTMELEISHMLSNAQVYRIEWPFNIGTSVDARSGKEYLLCALDPEVYKVFFAIQVPA